ncbi:helix-turn-helix transcriptional regulator [Paenibacillus foliorum]|nr:WYL domain-containing protein [Paenibacillus foliorum]
MPKSADSTDSVNSLSRIVQIKQRLLDGEELTLQELCDAYGKHAETIKKDISIIRNELAHKPIEIEYNRLRKSYRLLGSESENHFISALTVLMVLYGCRALSTEEMQRLESYVTDSFSPQVQQRLKKYTGSFRFHYKPILNKNILGTIEDLFRCIVEQHPLSITYLTILKEIEHHELLPYTLMFNEGYFYLAALPVGEPLQACKIYRIDQIMNYKIHKEQFETPQHGDRFFKPGEYVNFSFMMHYGEMNKVIRLKMLPFIESYFLAKFPVNRLIESNEEWIIYECTVAHEESALFWIFSERQWVEVLSPISLREKMKSTLTEMMKIYE